MNDLWKLVVDWTQLPPELEDKLLKQSGIMSAAYDDQRRHRRFYFRETGVLRCGIDQPVMLGVYCHDLSRNGLGFFSPRQLLPLQQARLTASETRWFDLRVRWCKRLTDTCYHVGCDFDTDGPPGPSLW